MYGIKADETRRSYVNRLELFFDFHGIEKVDIKEKSDIQAEIDRHGSHNVRIIQ